MIDMHARGHKDEMDCPSSATAVFAHRLLAFFPTHLHCLFFVLNRNFLSESKHDVG